MQLKPDYQEIERFIRWRFNPFPRGYLLRVQIYDKTFSTQWRVVCGSQDDAKGEHIAGTPASAGKKKEPGHWRIEVGSMDSLCLRMRALALEAANKSMNIAVAPTLFEDGIHMDKNEVALWLGFGLDFDAPTRDGKRVGPFDGIRRLIESNFTPRAVVVTGSRWVNGHGDEPKFHALFSFAPPVTGDALPRAEKAVKAFTQRMGADPACAESTRVMRLPGSIHPTDFDKSGNVTCGASLCRIEYLQPAAL